MNKGTLYLLLIFGINFCTGQSIAVLKYDGGGDWYSNPTALKNLINFCNTTIQTAIEEKPQSVEVGSTAIFEYPFLHMTGHGNVTFSESDSKNLRMYLLSGGFLHIDDNYGMKTYVVKELKKVFPEKEMTEIPLSHSIYNNIYPFPKGLPKIHEHDGLAPKALGYFHESKLILLFTYESDLGDGWEDANVHNDPEDVRLKALKMGANIIKYAFEN
jgi:hypothetical protein|tara:strand:- start:1937 stop:2581 length:645 start_codon:yes stop_codon:yes gene_type:complete